jgi:hypothetical protein
MSDTHNTPVLTKTMVTNLLKEMVQKAALIKSIAEDALSQLPLPSQPLQVECATVECIQAELDAYLNEKAIRIEEQPRDAERIVEECNRLNDFRPILAYVLRSCDQIVEDLDFIAGKMEWAFSELEKLGVELG